MESPASELFSFASPEVAVARPLLGKGLRWLSFVAGVAPLAIIMVAGAIFGMQRPDSWPTIVSTFFSTAAISGVASFVALASFRKRPAQVSTDGQNIDFTYAPGDVLRIPKRDVRQAAIVADPLTPGLSLDLSLGRSMSVRTRTVEDAQRFLSAMGPDAGQARYRTQLLPSLVGAAGGCLSLGAVFLTTVGLMSLLKAGLPDPIGGAAWLFVTTAVLSLLFLFTSRPEVEVGADGVVVRQLGRSRFVAFRDLESVGAENKRVVLRYPDGRTEEIRLSQITFQQVAALDDRLSRAFAAARSESPAGRAGALARKGRSFEQWREHLAGLLARGEGYREAALTREEAESVLAAGDAPPEQRLGAALALQAADPEHARARARIAAEACANPKLRVALERVSEGDVESDAVTEALADEAESHRAGETT